jgi:hypothetical protein
VREDVQEERCESGKLLAGRPFEEKVRRHSTSSGVIRSVDEMRESLLEGVPPRADSGKLFGGNDSFHLLVILSFRFLDYTISDMDRFNGRFFTNHLGFPLFPESEFPT